MFIITVPKSSFAEAEQKLKSGEITKLSHNNIDYLFEHDTKNKVIYMWAANVGYAGKKDGYCMYYIEDFNSAFNLFLNEIKEIVNYYEKEKHQIIIEIID